MKINKIMLFFIIACAVCGLVIGIYTAVANLSVYFSVRYSVHTLDDIPEGDYDAIVVLGCGLKKDCTPSDMLYDRIMTGVKAAEANPSAVLFMSGDHSREGYDEVGQMKITAINAGINPDRIICDGFGLNTYDTFARLSEMYSFKKIIVITQKFHLNRSLYTAKSLGFECDGICADPRGYAFVWVNYSRDFIAVDKYFIMLKIKPEPTKGFLPSLEQQE